VFDRLAAAGVDYADVAATLEREGIEKFVSSFDQVLQRIATTRLRLTAAA